jgi:hypothetical protein
MRYLGAPRLLPSELAALAADPGPATPAPAPADTTPYVAGIWGRGVEYARRNPGTVLAVATVLGAIVLLRR